MTHWVGLTKLIYSYFQMVLGRAGHFGEHAVRNAVVVFNYAGVLAPILHPYMEGETVLARKKKKGVAILNRVEEVLQAIS